MSFIASLEFLHRYCRLPKTSYTSSYTKSLHFSIKTITRVPYGIVVQADIKEIHVKNDEFAVYDFYVGIRSIEY